ncbi:mucin-2 [Streptomyces sp. TR1341]|uniref:mucin-2 n=1 Tax=Streptomyces sp. TR1341 TaxID=2601266 RepID=UPI00138B10BD|nr:mucin-2 [Streptomyces sp. TR1341]
MRNYATAQALGSRTTQCDATAIHTAPDGSRAFALLDGIGDYRSVRDWTRTAARRVARAASRRADAEAGLRHIYEGYAADPDRQDPYTLRYMPRAAAVVAVAVPGEPLKIAWCGDARAYLLTQGLARRLTEDHNLRRVYPPTARYPEGGDRNTITSYLGHAHSDVESMGRYNHPAIEATTVDVDGPARLVLASDGAYEPHGEAGHDLFVELAYEPLDEVARDFVSLAVATSLRITAAEDPTRPYADNASALLADLV